jgi:hypothetical protein
MLTHVEVRKYYFVSFNNLWWLKYWIQEFKSERTLFFDDERQGSPQVLSYFVDEKIGQIVRKGVILMDFAEKWTKINAGYCSDLVASARAKWRKKRNIPL